jgi:hypothetical protein
MARIAATVEESDEIENEDGRMVTGLIITCTKCGHSVEVYGTSDASARRGGVMLHETCPKHGNNFYVVEE